MVKKKLKDPLETIGIILVIISAIILVSAFPLALQTMIQVGPVKADVPPISATRIALGSIGILLGLVVRYGKSGLKILLGK